MIKAAEKNYKTAQNLAITIRNKDAFFTKTELLQIKKIFSNWSSYFEEQAKNTSDKRKKINYVYMKNRFQSYYKLIS